MKVSAISQNNIDCSPRRNMFIKFSNSFMSFPMKENPAEPTDSDINPDKKSAKLGIENLQEFTVFPKETVDGRTIITA